jgi:D-lyxose ketol-isomerase
MLTRAEYRSAQTRAAAMIRSAGIRIKEEESAGISVADFGLSNLPVEGAQILTFFATHRVSAKVIVLFPGENTLKTAIIPSGKERFYTCRHEVVMEEGDQLILEPGTKHWFQAGAEGAVMYSFSTCVRDVLDGFTDPEVVRETVVVD